MANEQMKFIKKIAQPEISASGKIEIDLNDVRGTYGDNLNTLMITNTDAGGDISVYADGEEIAFVTSNNGAFSFDWEMGLNFNFISIKNHNAGAVIVADKIKVFVGRTGGK